MIHHQTLAVTGGALKKKTEKGGVPIFGHIMHIASELGLQCA
jgi:hypothetical protein